ncbi:hypothetical protein BZG02_08690 [Labilibaculum filiforme]|uniref:TonB-dependent receptor n=1 Tax=Labilibaculum filiforme TaxID=1940526 RepID=A0A2N3HZF1_9BACT|nr:TonB-dependent receptor [Labilibaculum filiforme]PKQ63446.1 hypothetical protein BZG02_08690 [Labilibaculum filiforme]
MQFKSYLLICLFLGLSQGLFAQVGALSGTVTEKDGTTPLIGANVYFYGTTIGVATDSEGYYSFRNLKVGAYEIVVSYSGYGKTKEMIEIKDGINTLNFQLEKSEKEIGEVVITGTGTPHHLKNAPVQTELISKKLIEAVAPSDFADLMTGVSPSFDFSPGSMGAFMQLNGLGNDYILVLVDGKRLYGDIGGQNDISRINPDDIERLEVVKGASSSLYGSEAIAGVINVITKKSKRKVAAESNSRFSEYGNRQYFNKVGLNLGRFSSLTTYTRKESKGWQVSKFEIQNDMDTEDTSDDVLVATDAKQVNAYEDYTISQRFDYALTKKLSVYALGSTYEKDVLYPVTVKKYGYYYKDFSYSAGAKYLLNKKDYISLDFNSDEYKYYYKYNQEDISSKTGEQLHALGDKILNTNQKREDVNLKYIFKIRNSHQFTLGGEYVNESLESDGRLVSAKEEAYTFAAFAQDEIKLIKNLSLVAGIRYVKHKEFGSDFTPKLSTLYKWNAFNFRATYAKGFKAPTLKELYYHYEKSGTLYLGNVDLDAQKSDYYSFSVEYIVSKLSLSVSAYQNSINDMISYRSIETSASDLAEGVKKTREHYNIGETKSQGFDFLFNVKVGAGFTFGGGYSYVDAMNETDDIRLENVARNYVNLRLLYDRNWKDYALNVSLTGRIQDDKFYEGEKNAEGYNLWKLTTAHRFTGAGTSFEITAGLDNIFDYVDDRPYGSHYGTLNPGRTVFVGCNIKFAK